LVPVGGDDMKTFLWLQPDNRWSRLVRRLEGELASHGWQGVERGSDYDVILTDNTMIEMAAAKDRPLVMFDLSDGSHLGSGVWEQLDNPNLKAVLKVSALKNPFDYNMHRGRRHTPFVYRPARPHAIGDLEKIKAFASYGAMEPLDAATESYEEGERNITAFFAGTTEYRPETPEGFAVSEHRRQCLRAVSEIEGAFCVDSKAYRRDQYLSLMRRSQFAVCPWGWGEATYREYEAALCGAIPIRPKTPWQEEPDGIQCIWCEPDFSDLKQLLDDIQEPAARWIQHAKRVNRERVLRKRMMVGERLVRVLNVSCDSAVETDPNQTPCR